IPRFDDVLAFVRGYEPPRFPGPLDSVLARAGRDSYRVHCAECHGMYDASLSTPRLQSFPNRFVSQVEIGTDPARLDVLDTTLLRALKASAYRRHVDAGAQPTRRHVAAPLPGVVGSAPAPRGSSPSRPALSRRSRSGRIRRGATCWTPHCSAPSRRRRTAGTSTPARSRRVATWPLVSPACGPRPRTSTTARFQRCGI